MTGWRYGLLGPVEVRLQGRVVPLAGAKQRLVLSMLLLDANRTVSADRLAEELWGDRLPADPAAAVRTQISRLRRALGTAGEDLVTAHSGYRLRLERSQLDVTRFEDALDEASQADDEQALALLDTALASWRGPPLAEFADRPFAELDAVRLADLRAAATERRAELLLSLGRVTDAVAALQLIVAEHPEREGARGLLMRALYHSGRHTDALTTYQSWRHHLVEELGLDPSPDLQSIEQDILRHGLTGPPATHRTQDSTPLLPLPVTSFVGREEERASLTALLSEVRLVTLHGPGGVGKTRLALELASVLTDGYRDGIRFCDLAAARRPATVVRAIATAVGLEERAFRRLEDQLVEHLVDRHVLLLLDNCEHVAAAVAGVAERLLRETRTVSVLATSRERLKADGEHIWPVEPLATAGADAPAVQLFLDRAHAADRTTTRKIEDVATITAICDHLDGLPLAIELAAARLPGTTVTELDQSLRSNYLPLTTGRRADSRHSSLHAVVDWSYTRLDPVQRRVFDGLSVFRGHFDADAARATAHNDLDAGDVAEALLHLVDRSLITADADGDTTRYALLETLRGYGLERLDERGELDAARDRHADWAVELVTRASRGLCGADEAAWTTTLDRHFDDLRAAHSWLVGRDPGLALRMVAELHWYALWRCQSELFRWAEVSTAATAGSHSPAHSDALASAAIGAAYRGDLESAQATAQAAYDAALGRSPIPGRPLEALGEIAILHGDLDRAADLFRRAHELSMSSGKLLDAVWSAASASVAFAYHHQEQEARHAADLARATAQTCRAPSALALAAWTMGEILADTNPDEARQHLQHAIALAEPVGSRLIVGFSEVTLATLHARHDDPATALRYYENVIPEWRKAGAWTPQWVTVRTLVDLLASVNATHDAAVLHAAVTSAGTGAPPYGNDEQRLRRSAARLRGQLSTEEFKSCAQKGAKLSDKDAVDFALDAARRATDKLPRDGIGE